MQGCSFEGESDRQPASLGGPVVEISSREQLREKFPTDSGVLPLNGCTLQ